MPKTKNEPAADPIPAYIEELVKDLPPLLSVTRLAEFATVHRSTVSRWIADGKLRTFRTAKSGPARTLIPRGDVARLLVEMQAADAVSE